MTHKISCDVINYLLPFYTEGLMSKDARSAMEAHIQTCQSCKEKLNKVLNATISVDNSTTACNTAMIHNAKFMRTTEIIKIAATSSAATAVVMLAIQTLW